MSKENNLISQYNFIFSNKVGIATPVLKRRCNDACRRNN